MVNPDSLFPVAREMLYHAGVRASGMVRPPNGSSVHEQERSLLRASGSFERVFRDEYGVFSDSKLDSSPRIGRLYSFLESLGEDDYCSMSRLGDGSFPLNLSSVEDATPILYYRGNLELLSFPVVAVLGSSSALRTSVSHSYLDLLKDSGVSVLSSFSGKSDLSTHEYLLNAGYPSVALLEGSFDDVKSSNHDLFDRLSSEGLVLSYTPVGFESFSSTGLRLPVTHRHKSFYNSLVALSSKVLLTSPPSSGTRLEHAARAARDQRKPLASITKNKRDDSSMQLKFGATILPRKAFRKS